MYDENWKFAIIPSFKSFENVLIKNIVKHENIYPTMPPEIDNFIICLENWFVIYLFVAPTMCMIFITFLFIFKPDFVA